MKEDWKGKWGTSDERGTWDQKGAHEVGGEDRRASRVVRNRRSLSLERFGETNLFFAD